MKKNNNKIIRLLFFIFIMNWGINLKEGLAMNNPLFFKQNEPIDFASLKATDVKEASDSIINLMKESLKKIYAIKADKRTFENSIESFDIIYDKLNGLNSVIFLLSYVHPDSAVRVQSQECIAELSKYGNELSLDENLYKVFTEYAAVPEAQNLNDAQKKLIKEQIDDFNRNGFKLPEAKRNELKVIKDSLSDISLKFGTNINEYNDFIIITYADTAGLPEDYLETVKQEDGTYKIDLSYPSYRPFMKYAKSGEKRKELLIKYLNRAADKNIDLLQDLLKERVKMAKLLGYETYAQYSLENKMAKKPETVWNFENSLTDKLKIKAKKDYQELLEIKNSYTNDHSTVINAWESGFYDNILLKEKYELDQEKLKEYFELKNVIDGLFTISQTLYGLKFEELKDPSVWHEEVKMFNVFENGKLAGYFYLDLHPRENKYNHAACFSMINGVGSKKVQQLPSATLVCNFPRVSKERPALITHGDVVTMFHEFGHLLHHLIAVTPMSMLSGISTSRDFVEVPSQFLENWAWSYESLKLFAKHYKTGEVLPEPLYNKMIAAKNVGSGIAKLQQVYYGELDMTFHDKYDPFGTITTTEIVKKLQDEITLYPYVENTHMQAGFGHLTGYAAGYYGYLWAEVFSEDCFSLFEKGGILNQEIGKRFKKEILSQGSSKDEMEMIKAFLQREPNDEAFLKSIGL